MWVIVEGITFVRGFDSQRSALIMTPLLHDAKLFASLHEAQRWVIQHGSDLESHRILSIEEALQDRRVLDP